MDYLSDETREHFENVRRIIDAIGLSYEIDPRLVRGLDYYSRTAFEFVSDSLGSQDALGGGGRYDGLSEQLGGKPLPAVGFAAGLERLLMVLEKNDFAFPADALEVYCIGLEDDARKWVLELSIRLRRKGVPAECDFAARSLKAQMREANRLGAKYVVIVGQDEMDKQSAAVKDMGTGEQEFVVFADLLSYFERRVTG